MHISLQNANMDTKYNTVINQKWQVIRKVGRVKRSYLIIIIIIIIINDQIKVTLSRTTASGALYNRVQNEQNYEKHSDKIGVFKDRPKVGRDGADDTEWGRAFQARAAANRERSVAKCSTEGGRYDKLWCCSLLNVEENIGQLHIKEKWVFKFI